VTSNSDLRKLIEVKKTKHASDAVVFIVSNVRITIFAYRVPASFSPSDFVLN